ncbi:uncharacterized protein LOC119170678 isoform X2 [Rhipicephalus microplus]|uniref:uncharacterized protein LOC119170678 isoform X2 n=1 Tax=Rhipicephalus microplus TaxID=6941 RepID=UPI003F6BC29D
MRSATFLLLLVILAPILEVTSFGFGVLLARIVARLPQLLRPALRLAAHIGHYGSEIADAALQIQRKSEEPELPDVYGIGMWSRPGPHDLLHNPNDDITGYTARIMARLPQLLRPALRLERKSDEPELPDVYGIGMWSRPGPHDLLPNPNDNITGYTGPGIKGVPEFSANSSTKIICGKCHCTFPWKAKFYGKKIGCKSDVTKFTCTCLKKSCHSKKIVKCLINLEKGKCVANPYHIDCLPSNKKTG